MWLDWNNNWGNILSFVKEVRDTWIAFLTREQLLRILNNKTHFCETTISQAEEFLKIWPNVELAMEKYNDALREVIKN